MSALILESIPSPARRESKGEGLIRADHPHLYPLPPTEGEEVERLISINRGSSLFFLVPSWSSLDTSDSLPVPKFHPTDLPLRCRSALKRQGSRLLLLRAKAP